MSSISPTKSPRRRRFLAGALFVLACLATFVVAVYLEERIRGRHAWRAYAADARQRGAKLDFGDFIPPKIPDAGNFASIPLFADIFRAEDAAPTQPFPYPLTLPPPPNREPLPLFSDPNAPRRIDLAAWQKYFVEVQLLPAAGENAATDTLRALERFAPLLAQLREAGARPACRFPVHWERTFEAGLPHLVVFLSASKFCALRMAAHLELGQSAAAYEDWHDGLRLLVLTAREPTIINAIVRISCLPLLVNGVWNGLGAHQWAEPELRKIESDLGSLDWLEDYVFSMRCERAVLNTMTEMMIDRPEQLATIVGILKGMQGDGKEEKYPSWVWRFYPTGWLSQGQVMTNRFFDASIARVDPVQQRCFRERPVFPSPEKLTTRFQRMRYVLFAVGAPGFLGMEKRFVWAATVTAQARLACALERFRLSRGNFPAVLSELTPEYLPDLPAEIVNGEPYRYHRLEDGTFVLYSVGPDGRDDGGRLDPKIMRLDRQLDWIWRYPAP